MIWILAGLALAASTLAAALFVARGRDAALLAAARERAAGLEATLAAERRAAGEKLGVLEQSRAALQDAFARLGREALEQNNAAFLERAKVELERVSAQAAGKLALEKQAVEALVVPIAQSLAKVDGQIQTLEKDRAASGAALREQLAGLAAAQQQLAAEAGKLSGALRSSNVRGSWGQIQLRRVLELAGMLEHCDFEEQPTLATGERPDVLVTLAGGRQIAVDSKAPMQAFLDAAAAAGEDVRAQRLREHVQQLRARVTELSSKAYWARLPRSVDMVVLFLPSESLLHAALQEDERLIEDAHEDRVVFATPLTLLALLRAVAHGWREARIAESAQAISEQGRALYERMRLLAEHLTKVGVNLQRAVNAYNESVGSLERQVLPAARRFKELGTATEKDIEPLERVDTEVRPVIAAELAPSERT
ncbi:MAG TPA: DNA recombination protein RmuC [Myxococcales bacterium]|nr:DNA recombination protein RmuC [Myxococcales bacterium]